MNVFRPVVKKLIRIKHIPFDLMKSIRKDEKVQCLCKDCVGYNIQPNIPISQSILYDEEYKNTMLLKRRNTF